jgi:hypothetical protein
MGINLKYRKTVSLILVSIFALVFSFCGDNNEAVDSPLTVEDRLEELLATYDRDFLEYLANAQQTMGKTIMTVAPVSSITAIPKYMEIEGSHYDYGTLVALIARQSGREPRRVSSGNIEFNNRIIDMYQNVYPQFLEIAGGVGDVFGIPVDELDFIFLEDEFFYGLFWNLFKYDRFQALNVSATSGLPEIRNDCALLSARFGNNTVVGRNFDSDHLKPHFIVKTRMDGGYRVLANASYTVYHWVMDGINERGLVMGTAANTTPPEYFWTDPYPSVPAIQQNHLFRIALETCATVDQVIAFYRSIRPWSPHSTGHLLVADALGNSAVIEFGLDREPDFFRTENDNQVLTNIAYHMGIEYMMDNCWRFRTATSMAANGINSADDVLDIMHTIRGTHGYTAIFNIRERLMRGYYLSDETRHYDFRLE